MPKKGKISEKDLNAFREAVKGTQPLKSDKVRLAPSASKKRQIKRRLDYYDADSIQLSETLALDPVQGEEFIAYKQTGVSNKILRKLRKGQYNVDAILDLHGMSIEEAIEAVEGFLKQCLHEGIRVVLIIHGKGRHGEMPVLKNKLNHWLREINIVLAFCSAAPSHGSRGAIYVLLKRSTEET
ncbi:putative DNA endonuclease SmrA [Aquicella siphonis]|uniref:Putative DNA endonuclease SmrA n=1 Tax=Aquicella siphonis TaxID=254247 RepID=A0A5E4PHH2_9COXI|nr:Smr/MutS family protein [Aquicella siphonis]VVC75897.1 putative DNA endonuclease SmrA [Aquicella siphonis]